MRRIENCSWIKGEVKCADLRVSRRCVVERLVCQQDLVVENGRADGLRSADEIIAHDDNGQAGHTGVLLRAGNDGAVVGHIHRTGEKVGGHVKDDGHVLADGLHCKGILHSVNGFIVRVEQIFAFWIDLKEGSKWEP